jgi:hypothetical protein
MAQTPKWPPIKVLKVGVGSGGGAIQECDAIKYDGKLWLVPQWLDEPGRGTTKPRRMIRIDSLPHQPMTNPAFGLDFILNGPLPKAVLDGAATPEQAAQYEIVELPEIEIPMPQPPAKQNFRRFRPSSLATSFAIADFARRRRCSICCHIDTRWATRTE